ncbi:hydrogenase maturation peptidase HycI [Limnobaculum zhutongyuii]|uniref:Hydrogenase maturation peptidase HycI n=1 Tax=Limnobaculum zhutongyuii TaxID=2498113 RepID=A0A411WPJ6_9GAMM|nr:hydrogenase maturation peptidase HycI [Limnobaculum zhutongyuii]QBH98169.1 hydrogenase maturation peptidase HycI [Limnobaculum zhutongyuii]TQS86359.1 hydrogenase maturation peptidase HycI [Limnobaculum zhutongyuii]
MSQQTSGNNVVLTVGNNMMGDDGAGPLLYDMMNEVPISGWLAIDGGSAPENSAHQIRDLKPDTLIIVDAADMELDAGEIRIIDADMIAEMFIMSTHNLPLSFLIDQLKEDIPNVIFIGIQPSIVSFAFPMTDEVKVAVKEIYRSLIARQYEQQFISL